MIRERQKFSSVGERWQGCGKLIVEFIRHEWPNHHWSVHYAACITLLHTCRLVRVHVFFVASYDKKFPLE